MAVSGESRSKRAVDPPSGSDRRCSRKLEGSPSAVDLVLWLGLLAASYPTLEDLLGHIDREPWAVSCLVFWALLAREVCRREARGPRRSLGLVLVVVGMLVQYATLVSDWPRYARPGLALAFVGLGLARGHPAARVVWIALWTVPVPSIVVELTSPQLESGLLGAASSLVALVGAPIGRAGEIVTGPGGAHGVLAADGGIPLAVLLAGLAWYRGSRRREPLRAVGLRMIVWSALAIPLQFLVVLLFCVAVAVGQSHAGGLVLTYAPMAMAMAVLAVRRRPETVAG